MQRETIRPASEEAWLDLRTNDLTSTEAAVLFDRSPYQTLPELWDAKRSQVVLRLEESEAMKWGKALQGAIAEQVCKDQGWTNLAAFSDYIRIPELRLGSSFDYHCMTSEGPAILEVKNVNQFIFADTWPLDADGIQAPVHIELQVQHQLLVSDFRLAYIVALVGGNKAVLIKRTADPEVQQAMLVKSAEFWKTIDAGTPPAVDFFRDYAYILHRYKTVIPKTTADFSEVEGFRELAMAYDDLNAEIANKEQRQQGIKAQIVYAMGEVEKVYGADFTVSSRTTKDGRSIRVQFKKGK